MQRRNYLKTVHESRNAHKLKVLIALGVIVCLYILSSFVFGEMGLIKYYRMKNQYNALTAEIAKLKQDNVKLLGDVRALKNDPDRIEMIARDKLGLARPGEIVYYYGEP